MRRAAIAEAVERMQRPDLPVVEAEPEPGIIETIAELEAAAARAALDTSREAMRQLAVLCAGIARVPPPLAEVDGERAWLLDQETGRPMYRFVCKAGPKPCPFFGCAWHLSLDVKDLDSGKQSLIFNHPEPNGTPRAARRGRQPGPRRTPVISPRALVRPREQRTDSPYLHEARLEKLVEEALVYRQGRYSCVLDAIDGKGWGESHTLDDIGELYCLTRERIRQIEARSMKRARGEGPFAPVSQEVGTELPEPPPPAPPGGRRLWSRALKVRIVEEWKVRTNGQRAALLKHYGIDRIQVRRWEEVLAC